MLTPLVQAADTPALVLHPANGDVEYNSHTPVYVKCPDDSVDLSSETWTLLLDNRNITKQCMRLANGAVYDNKTGLAVGTHTIEVKAKDANSKEVSIVSKFTIGKEAANPLVVKLNIGAYTLLPKNMDQMWLQGDCNQSNLVATVSVNFRPAQAMTVAGTTIGTIVPIEDKNLFIITVSNTVTHCRYTY
jgi:hypothetical protein